MGDGPSGIWEIRIVLAHHGESKILSHDGIPDPMLSPRTNIRIVRRFFGKRFGLARLVGRHKSLGRLAEKMFFDGDEIYYLPSDSSVSKSRRIEVSIDAGTREDVVLPTEVVTELIERSRYIYIMDFCICRDSSHCKDYPTDLGCVFLGKGVLNIRGGVGRLATKEEARRHIDACKEAGLVQLVGRNKIDSVWLDTGRMEDLLTICNCCPCCCLWKMIPDLPENLSSKINRVPGVQLSVDKVSCTGCGVCAEYCFVDAISIDDGACRIDDEVCRGCGRCADKCPHDAITISVEEVSVNAIVDRMCELVDLTTE